MLRHQLRKPRGALGCSGEKQLQAAGAANPVNSAPPRDEGLSKPARLPSDWFRKLPERRRCLNFKVAGAFVRGVLEPKVAVGLRDRSEPQAWVAPLWASLTSSMPARPCGDSARSGPRPQRLTVCRGAALTLRLYPLAALPPPAPSLFPSELLPQGGAAEHDTRQDGAFLSPRQEPWGVSRGSPGGGDLLPTFTDTAQEVTGVEYQRMK